MVRNMPKKFLSFIKRNAIKLITLLTVASPLYGLCNDPFKKIDLKLPDGRSLHLKRKELHVWTLFLKDKNDKVLWQKTYSQDFDSLWDYAYFIKVKGKQHFLDVNGDGYPEIALSTWDGGNAPNRPAIIFTVKENELSVFKVVKEYPIESCKPVL